MATNNLLVVTPSPDFGELTRRSLEETGSYHVFVVNTKASAIVRADEEACGMAFLDLDMGEAWVEDVGKSLRTILPDIKLFVLAQNEIPPALDSIRPWTLVRKPFQTPELLHAIEHPTPAESISVIEENPQQNNLPWLNDVSKAAQHLTRLTLETSAQAALITRNNELWAYAGQLSQAAAKEISQTLGRTWSGQKGSDLLRFIRLDSTKAEHMLYATELSEGMLLAMVFDAETPFSTIRTQASQIATSLNDADAKEDKEASSKKPASEVTTKQPTSEIEDDEGIDVPPITEILVDIPSPDPKPGAPIPLMKPAPAASSLDQMRPADPGQTLRSILSL